MFKSNMSSQVLPYIITLSASDSGEIKIQLGSSDKTRESAAQESTANGYLRFQTYNTQYASARKCVSKRTRILGGQKWSPSRPKLNCRPGDLVIMSDLCIHKHDVLLETLQYCMDFHPSQIYLDLISDIYMKGIDYLQVEKRTKFTHTDR